MWSLSFTLYDIVLRFTHPLCLKPLRTHYISGICWCAWRSFLISHIPDLFYFKKQEKICTYRKAVALLQHRCCKMHLLASPFIWHVTNVIKHCAAYGFISKVKYWLNMTGGYILTAHVSYAIIQLFQKCPLFPMQGLFRYILRLAIFITRWL